MHFYSFKILSRLLLLELECTPNTTTVNSRYSNIEGTELNCYYSESVIIKGVTMFFKYFCYMCMYYVYSINK